MNREALEHWFENEMGLESGEDYRTDWDTGAYVLRVTTFSPDDLREITACGATIKVDHTWPKVVDWSGE